ncbi:TonB-dependent receptor [Luteimonas sp. TWI1416]|uniref:TonB-dependent receptor n=2 Tax=unclassified Luteimonas TaxID=2629088 RepID=UPI003207BB21
MRTMKRSILASTLAMCCAGQIPQAFAQDADSDTGRKAPDAVELDRVVATAQKRSENVMEVASGVSVISEERLEAFGATRLNDFAAYVPGFQVDSGGAPGQTAMALRGVAPLGGGSIIGTYIDDTPIGPSTNKQRATTYALDLLPYDIQSVEVLRGPQGTLYGAGAMGGLFKYITKAADPDAIEFRAGMDVNTTSEAGDLGTGLRAAINAPIVEGRVGLRASFSRQVTPGYVDQPDLTGDDAKDSNGYSQLASRVALTWRLTDHVNLRLQTLHQLVDADNTGQVGLTPTTLAPLRGELDGILFRPTPYRMETNYHSAILDWDLGNLDFVSATSFSETRMDETQDATLVYGVAWPLLTGGAVPAGQAQFDVFLGNRKWTQEFRLSSKADDRFEWLVGTFLTGEKHGNRQKVSPYDSNGNPLPFEAASGTLPGRYDEQALFADATYKFSPRFDVSAGVRYARNEQDFEQHTTGALYGGTLDLVDSIDENVFTWKLASRWHLDDRSMLYARYATGYRPGGPNVSVTGSVPMTRSDTLGNFELGYKSHFWDRRAMLDVAVFRIDWDDIQLRETVNGISRMGNAGSAKSQGLELAALVRATERITVGLNAAYTDSELGDVPPASGLTSGSRMPLTPRLSWSSTIDYDFEAGPHWHGRVGGGFRFTGNRVGIGGYEIESYRAVDLHAELTNLRWTARLYARNLTDERSYVSTGLVRDVFNRDVAVVGVPLQPRTVGMSIDYRF